ncbi:MAG: phosphoribosylformylglycinamidine synthase subunit PurL [Acidobacteria bacterium]|nr:phosphoribosylformylglycinamidine synthase subunit PurL [Acidobacteriota bacterium]
MIEQITPAIIANHGLSTEEYQKIETLLGRSPNLTELGIFSVMWSEHCSYKSSRFHLKRLPTKGDVVVQGPGENAGIVDIGSDWCVAFKIESHNHPSFIEPFQGAATGVGGILRDIFTMGARPLAILNSLRFGSLETSHNRYLMNKVVAGIANYGNSFGCPTLGGEIYFDNCYSKNPLVNVFALGVMKRDQIFLGKATGIGNSVIYVGAKTGRDGIHGATMASAEFDETTQEKRPTVQVGDPFLEKLLLEACLEAMRSGSVVGIQDMGAAGLTCSSCEMGARGATGIDIELNLVPLRETGMTPYEIMLSESQERMLLVAQPGREREVIDIFTRWGLDAVTIGRVTDTKHLRVFHSNILVADIPNSALTDEAPIYNRPMQAIDNPQPSKEEIAKNYPLALEDVNKTFNQLLTSPNLCSRKWVYSQYDHMVRTNTIVLPGSDSAVIRIKETRKAIAMSLDGNGRYCHLNPYEGAKLAIAEGCRNLVVTGAKPLAATNCLNFASPERPQVMWAFSQVVDGIKDACQSFSTPITGGNVSFYNETEGEGVYPTPVVGLVGLVEDTKQITTCGFKFPDEIVLLLGETKEDLGGSEYLAYLHNQIIGQVPSLDLDYEKQIQQFCLKIINRGLVSSAHDVSDGGLLIALAECTLASQSRNLIGATFEINLSSQAFADNVSFAAALFGESPSRIIISVKENKLKDVEELAKEQNIVCTRLGRTGGENFLVKLNGQELINENLAELNNKWQKGLDNLLDNSIM